MHAALPTSTPKAQQMQPKQMMHPAQAQGSIDAMAKATTGFSESEHEEGERGLGHAPLRCFRADVAERLSL